MKIQTTALTTLRTRLTGGLVLGALAALAACGGTEDARVGEESSALVVPIYSKCTPDFDRCNRRCARITDPTAQDSCYASCGEALQACVDCGDPYGCIIQ